jgi:hypothetical protein
MEQRRRRRAALEKKRRKEQAALRRKLILAAVILTACLGLVLWLTKGSGSAAQPGEDIPGQLEVPEFTFTAPPEERATLRRQMTAGKARADPDLQEAAVPAIRAARSMRRTAVPARRRTAVPVRRRTAAPGRERQPKRLHRKEIQV